MAHIPYNTKMGRKAELLQVNHHTKYSGSAEIVANTGAGDKGFLSYSRYDSEPKTIDNVNHCIAVLLMNWRDKKTQILHVSPQPGKVVMGHSTSSKKEGYFVKIIKNKTPNFRHSRGPKTAMVLGGVNSSMPLGCEIDTPRLTQSDIYHATLQVVASALSLVNIDAGPSNLGSSRMMWVALLSLPQSFQVQYLHTLAFNKAVPQDY